MFDAPAAKVCPPISFPKCMNKNIGRVSRLLRSMKARRLRLPRLPTVLPAAGAPVWGPPTTGFASDKDSAGPFFPWGNQERSVSQVRSSTTTIRADHGASITHATAQQMMVRGLIERQSASRFQCCGAPPPRRSVPVSSSHASQPWPRGLPPGRSGSTRSSMTGTD